MKKIDQLRKELGIEFKNTKIINQAFIHRSYLNETKNKVESNERLEFLGDSILSYLVSKFLFLTYPKMPEGDLTNLRSSIVKTSTLASIAKSLDLGAYLYLSKGEEEGGGRTNPSLLADTFEALIGAIFLDQGIETVEILLNNLFAYTINNILKEKSYKDAKSDFQEMVQEKIKISPVYKVIKEEGPDHAKKFTVGVYVSGIMWGVGEGKSKQEAEKKAASIAIEKWKSKLYNTNNKK